MNKIIKKTLLATLILSLIVLSACSTKYVCYDGSVTRNAESCPVMETPTIVQRQAENAVDAYASAYATANGATHRRINTFQEGAHWYSEVVFTSAREGTVNHVTLKINGRTASITCEAGCEYLNRSEIDLENTENEPENQTE